MNTQDKPGVYQYHTSEYENAHPEVNAMKGDTKTSKLN
jgi:hypothetical protein